MRNLQRLTTTPRHRVFDGLPSPSGLAITAITARIASGSRFQASMTAASLASFIATVVSGSPSPPLNRVLGRQPNFSAATSTALQFPGQGGKHGRDGCAHCRAALIMATILARTLSGSLGQASTTAAKSGSLNTGPVALSVARGGREPPLVVASWRRSVRSSFDASPSPSAATDVFRRPLSPVDACTEKVEAAGIAPASRLTQVTLLIYFATSAPKGCRNCVGTAWHSVSWSRTGTA